MGVHAAEAGLANTLHASLCTDICTHLNKDLGTHGEPSVTLDDFIGMIICLELSARGV